PTPHKGIVKKTKRYAVFLMDHVKRGEVPWTQWYCCHVVNGFELPSLVSFSLYRLMVEENNASFPLYTSADVTSVFLKCEKENHRIHKNCKNCKHRVCKNCIKGTL
ncbi:hypothetical protein Golomagni_05400, partial [Golovinomyces magnicellulatus]